MRVRVFERIIRGLTEHPFYVRHSLWANYPEVPRIMAVEFALKPEREVQYQMRFLGLASGDNGTVWMVRAA